MLAIREPRSNEIKVSVVSEGLGVKAELLHLIKQLFGSEETSLDQRRHHEMERKE